MKVSDFPRSDEWDYDGYGEDYMDDLNQWQKAALTRWARAYNYRTVEGYLTARHGVEWKDYSYLRENSP